MKATFDSKSLRITNYKILFAILTVFALTITDNAVVSSQGPTPTDDEVNKIAKQLYCPVCENTPLDVCPTEACRQWREEIRTMLAAGKSEDEIKQHFVDYYGARVLNEPPNRLMTYLVPAVAILLGALLLLRGFQIWMKPAPTEAGVGAAHREAKPVQQDEYVARLEEELKKRK
jgi:cytochrome c-type biogenesis protein CcmH